MLFLYTSSPLCLWVAYAHRHARVDDGYIHNIIHVRALRKLAIDQLRTIYITKMLLVDSSNSFFIIKGYHYVLSEPERQS